MTKPNQLSNKVSVRRVLLILDKSDRRFLYFGMILRMMTNFFDLFGLAGVALLALSITQLSSSNSGSANVEVPILGNILLDDKTTVLIALGIATLFLAKSLSAIKLNSWIGLRIAKIEAKAARTILLRIFSSREPKYFVDSVSGLQNLLTTSLNALFSNLLTSLVTLISEFSLLTILLIGFIFVSPVATLGMLFYLGFVILGLNYFVAKRIQKESALGYKSLHETLQTTKDLFSVRKEVFLDGNTNSWIDSIESSKLSASQSTVRGLNLNGIPRYVIETALIFGVFVFMASVLLYSSLADQAVVIGVFLTGGLRLVASMLPLQAALNTFKNSSVSGAAAFEILQIHEKEPELKPDRHVSIDGTKAYSLAISNLNFSYSNDRKILDDVSFTILAGSKSAIVGPSGSGKTTIFDLSLGFLLPTSGKITIENIDPYELISNKSGTVGYVPQKPHLISGTFLSNLTLSPQNPDEFSSKDIQRAISLSGLQSVLEKLKDGLDTWIEPDSSSLSGGEIQRMGLARALLRSPKLLLLDEATSALDAQTEDDIIRSLDSLNGEVTILVIAHRLSTVLNADNIVYLSSGEILGQGTFQELSETLPEFREAVDLMSLEQNQTIEAN